jgi:hypothetical protein
MVKELLDSGIFSFKPEGNYQLERCGVIVSPRASGLWRPILYFTKRKDAEKYAELKYANAQYEVTINKVEKEFNPKRLK